MFSGSVSAGEVVDVAVDFDPSERIVRADRDRDGDVDIADYDGFWTCLTGVGQGPARIGCGAMDFDGDRDVDLVDLSLFQRCMSGSGSPSDLRCMEKVFDGDWDGAPDTEDNCLTNYNADQADTDHDGIGDVCDNCPTAPNADQNDEDNDTVGDVCDQCPNTNAGAEVDPAGCAASQRDSDRDGVTDDADQCANTPEGTVVGPDGCPIGGGPVCGNGVVETGEQCDDGNITSGDGCSSSCQIEPGVLPNDTCWSPTAVGDGTRAFTNKGSTTDGPVEPTRCNFFSYSQIDSDVWYCYSATCMGTAFVSLCGSDYDTKLAVYAGCDCPTAAPLACSDDDCGTAAENVQSRVTIAVASGQTYLVRVGGYLGKQGDGRLTIGCNVDGCANGSGDCYVASPNQEPGCGDAICCGKTCDLDQFCCDVTWDTSCAGEAEGVCDGSFRACGPGSGVCGTPDSTPGCDSASCCNRVCLVDPFCCLDAWDATCVDEANSMCFLTCGIGAGDCHAAHTTPGCNADACCQAVCTDDPFCCDTNWDQMCVDKAAASTSCP